MESPQPTAGAGSGAGAGGGSGSDGMTRCPSCGAKNKDTFEYCVRCAEPLDEWAPEGHVAQGRAIQAKILTGGVLAIGILALFAALKSAVEPEATVGPQTPLPPTETDYRPAEPILPETTPAAAMADFGAATKAFNEGDYELAVSLFQDVVAELPENPTAFQFLGLAHYHLGDHGSAMDALEEAHRLRPRSFELVDHYVTIAKEDGNLQAAIDLLQDFVAANPESRLARIELTRLARQTGNTDLAVEQGEILASTADDPAVAYELAVSLKDAGRLEEAKAAFRTVIERDPETPQAHHALGVTELLSGNPEGAVDALETAVSQAPTNGDFHFSLAQAYEKARRIPESLAAYEAYLEHARPDDQRAKVVRERLEIAKKTLAERNRTSGGTS